mgnify:CR=1 FL=1
MSGAAPGGHEAGAGRFLRAAPGSATVLAAIADTEAELCRRLDSLEVIVMEIRSAQAGPDPAPALLADLGRRLEAAIDRLACLSGARAAAAAGERAALGGLHQALGAQVARLDAAVVRLEEREPADPAPAPAPAPMADPDPAPALLADLGMRLEAAIDRLACLSGARAAAAAGERAALGGLHQVLGAQVARLDAAVFRLEQREPADRAPAPEPDPAPPVPAPLPPIAPPVSPSRPLPEVEIRAEIRVASERIVRALNGRDHRLEAERLRLGRFLSALERALPPPDPLPSIEDCGNARIAALEAALERLVAGQAETREAIRDMGMAVAELLAREERQARGTGG